MRNPLDELSGRVPGLPFTDIRRDGHGGPTHLFFVLLAPEDSAADHLKALARISRLLKDSSFRARLMQGKTAEEVYRVIKEEDDKF